MDDAGAVLEELVRGSGYRAVTLDRLLSQTCEMVGAEAACAVVRQPDEPGTGIVAAVQGLEHELIGLTIDDMDSAGTLVIRGGLQAPIPPPNGGRGRLEVDLEAPDPRAGSLISRAAALIGIALDQAKVPARLATSIIGETAELATDLDDRGAYGVPKEAEMEVARTAADSLGLSMAEVVEAEIATLLYPLGELARSDTRAPSLRRSRPLPPARFAEVAAETVMHVPGLEPLATILRHHEEHFDGSGGPDGLAGERIPTGSRIVGASKGLSALLFPSRGRPSLTVEEAFEHMRASAGSHYDPAIVDVLEVSLARIRAGLE
jgi:hypothetical protein